MSVILIICIILLEYALLKRWNLECTALYSLCTNGWGSVSFLNYDPYLGKTVIILNVYHLLRQWIKVDEVPCSKYTILHLVVYKKRPEDIEDKNEQRKRGFSG